jgi:hypothetical protein
MTGTVNHAICELSGDAYCACVQFHKNHIEMKKLEQEYFRYRELIEAQMRLRGRIMKILAILGVHFPEISPELGKLIDPAQIPSSDLRKKHIRLWEILELFLSSVNGKATAGEFEDFIIALGIDEVSATQQAIDSAVKSHPELFREKREGRTKFYLLQSMTNVAI